MKKVLITFFAVVCLSIGISFIFGNFIDFEKKISFYDYNSKNIFPDNEKLKSNLLIFKSNTNISDYEIKTNCKNNLEFIGDKKGLYFFNFTLIDKNCENSEFILTNGKEYFEKTKFKLNIEKKSDIFLEVVDYSNSYLLKINKEILEEIKKYSKYKKILNKNLDTIKKNRIYKELNYKKSIINNILKNRSKKYENPVKGYKISEELNEIPNAGRPYRNNYTDGIHHGWDIIAPKGTVISTIDDGVIIRVVDDFHFEDISNIQKEGKIDFIQKLRNLDILRGKQVWLKTSKGDVIFYSHMTDIYDIAKEGVFIESGTKIGTIGNSGVPDKDYTNFHLHFSIMKNPYDIEKKGKYSYEDYMNWDWYLKGLTVDEVIKKQKDIFTDDSF